MRSRTKTTAGVSALALWGVLAGTGLAQEKAPPAAKPADAPKVTAGGEGFVLQSSNGDYRLQLRGYVHFDGRFFSSDAGLLATDTFLLRRVRPIFAGTVGRHFEFQIMPDFGVGTTVLQDAWLDVNYSPKLRVRVGKFKSPVGLERLQSATALAFVERAYPTALVPNRDVGVMLHGDLAGGVVAYAAGRASTGPPTAAASTSTSPTARTWPGASSSRPSSAATVGPQGPGLRDRRHHREADRRSAGLSLGRPGQPADHRLGHHGRRHAQPPLPAALLLLGPLRAHGGVRVVGVVGEEGLDRDAREVQRRGVAGDRHLHPHRREGVLLGRAPERGLRARKGQVGRPRARGPCERASSSGRRCSARGSLDPAKSVRKAFAWAVGLNWYLNRNVKQVVNFERTTFTGGAEDGADRPAENAFFIRTQVSF